MVSRSPECGFEDDSCTNGEVHSSDWRSSWSLAGMHPHPDPLCRGQGEEVLALRALVPAHDSTPDLSIEYEVRGKKIVVRDARGWDFEAF